MMKVLATFAALVVGAQAKWDEPKDPKEWEEAVAHRRRRQDIRYFQQDAEAGYFQPYQGLEHPEFVAQAVPAHMYSQPPALPQGPAQQQAFPAPPQYQKQYSVYPYQPPHMYIDDLANSMLGPPSRQ